MSNTSAAANCDIPEDRCTCETGTCFEIFGIRYRILSNSVKDVITNITSVNDQNSKLLLFISAAAKKIQGHPVVKALP